MTSYHRYPDYHMHQHMHHMLSSHVSHMTNTCLLTTYTDIPTYHKRVYG